MPIDEVKPEEPGQEKQSKKTPKTKEEKQADKQAGDTPIKEESKLVKKRFPIAEFLMSLPENEQNSFGSKVVASYNDKSMSRESAMWLIGQHIDQLAEKYGHKF